MTEKPKARMRDELGELRSGPVRLRLSRAKGFKLQAHSQATNGLPAVKVDRSTIWGNRWKVGVHSDRLGRLIETDAEAVDAYRAVAPSVAWVRENLRGKNLACWCALGAPCHADVLLKIANQCRTSVTTDRIASRSSSASSPSFAVGCWRWPLEYPMALRLGGGSCARW
jgi:hypothetical protein